MLQNQEKTSENNSQIPAAKINSGNTAIQLKDNRETSVIQQKLTEQSTIKQTSFTPVQKKASNTGLPENLKSGIENLSGHSMDDVKVHYNSAQPAQLNAHAYAQGSDIHIASGQEKHLPHEAWHVVQQKQGRVKPTLQMKGKVNVNDDKGLEKEADVMGAKALQSSSKSNLPLKKTQTIKKTKQLFGWTRWYEYDGESYTPRFMGLPSVLGWIKISNHEGKEAYISITNIGKLPEIQNIEQGLASAKQVMDATTPLLKNVMHAVSSQGITVENLHQAQTKLLTLNTALNNYLNKTTTYFKMLGTVLGIITLGTGGILLSYLTLPQWLVGTIEGLSFLYGAALLYRWSKSQLLPTMAKIGLLIANGGIMGVTTAVTASQIIAYATGLSTTIPLQHIQFAAIPLALVLEHFIVLVIEKINAMRQFQNKQNGFNEEHID